MRQHHDDIRAQSPDLRQQLADYRGRVAEFERRDDFRPGRIGGFRRHDADHGDFHSQPLQHHKRLDEAQPPLPILFANIGRHIREARLRHPRRQFVEAPVELMVAQRHRIHLQGIQDLHDGFAIEEVGVRTALEHVAGADKNRAIGILGPLLQQKSAEFGRAWILPRFDQRAVKIIGCQDINRDDLRQFLRQSHAIPWRQANQQRQQQAQKLVFCSQSVPSPIVPRYNDLI